jgi:hypothetical protein
VFAITYTLSKHLPGGISRRQRNDLNNWKQLNPQLNDYHGSVRFNHMRASDYVHDPSKVWIIDQEQIVMCAVVRSGLLTLSHWISTSQLPIQLSKRTVLETSNSISDLRCLPYMMRYMHQTSKSTLYLLNILFKTMALVTPHSLIDCSTLTRQLQL